MTILKDAGFHRGSGLEAINLKILPFLKIGAKSRNAARWVLLPTNQTVTLRINTRRQREASEILGKVARAASQ